MHKISPLPADEEKSDDIMYGCVHKCRIITVTFPMALYPSELLYQMSLIVLVPRAGPEKRHPWRRPICRCRARNHSASVHWMSEVRIQGIEENDGPTLSVMIAIFACWVVAYL